MLPIHPHTHLHTGRQAGSSSWWFYILTKHNVKRSIAAPAESAANFSPPPPCLFLPGPASSCHVLPHCRHLQQPEPELMRKEITCDVHQNAKSKRRQEKEKREEKKRNNENKTVSQSISKLSHWQLPDACPVDGISVCVLCGNYKHTSPSPSPSPSSLPSLGWHKNCDMLCVPWQANILRAQQTVDLPVEAEGLCDFNILCITKHVTATGSRACR